MQSALATALALAVTSFVGGCAAEPASSDELCAQARSHLAACFGAAPADTECDPDSAATVLEQSCAQLIEPGKQDWVSSSLCRLGVLSRCAVPACEAKTPARSCAAYIEREDCSQCDYYLCRDAAAPASCGATGYYRGFGYEYCQRYLTVTTPKLSPAGQRFAHDVRRCLMRAMEDGIATDAACSDVKTAAYASHPDCYIEAGFCALPLRDWVAIAATIRPADSSFKEMIGTAIRCW